MEVKAKLKPGENGTKGLLREHGDQLVCVRYRYDKVRQKRYKTIELIVDEKDWVPNVLIPAEERVYIKIGYNEQDLRERVKRAGAYWNPDKKAWHLRTQVVYQLGLEHRILDGMP